MSNKVHRSGARLLAARTVGYAKPKVLPVREGFPVSTPEKEGVSTEVLGRIVAKAEREQSDALVIVKNGRLVFEQTRQPLNQPIIAMSITKSVLSLAVGMLIDEGKIASIDQSAAHFLPEWKGTPKEEITLRHLLSHTSGLPAERRWMANGRIEAGLDDALVSLPGKQFVYSNNACDLLGLLVSRAAGVGLDNYLERKLFAPLGIQGASFLKDEAGVPRAAGQLAIRPIDVAKLGQLVLQKGHWNGQQLVPARWLADSMEPSQPFDSSCGLLWWRHGKATHQLTPALLEKWAAAGISRAAIDQLAALIGRPRTLSEHLGAVRRAMTDHPRDAELLRDLATRGRVPMHVPGPLQAERVAARGRLGQFLVIDEKKQLVAVRMRAERRDDLPDGPEKHAYPSFMSEVGRL